MTDTNDTDGAALLPVTLADLVVQLSAIRTVLREAHFALDDSEDLSHLAEPVHAVPLDNVARLHRALKACERFAPKDEAWDGPGPLVTQIIEQLGHLLNRSAELQVALEDICDPIAALRRYASEQGRQLDGAVAFQMSNDPNHLKSIARAALSTPQRQEYDGEAVREAIERFLADYDDGDRADAGVHPLMEAHIEDFRAALAHPAQATPSAVSGDAGEGE